MSYGEEYMKFPPNKYDGGPVEIKRDLKKLRLLITRECVRDCAYCCNKEDKYKEIEKFQMTDDMYYDEIVITGGEPLLVKNLMSFLFLIRNFCNKISLYTAPDRKSFIDMIYMMLMAKMIDRVTISIHRTEDFEKYKKDIKSFPWDIKQQIRFNVPEFLWKYLKDDEILKMFETRKIQILESCEVPEDELKEFIIPIHTGFKKKGENDD